jgi:extracellular elastinolytic metalloproteinase
MRVRCVVIEHDSDIGEVWANTLVNVYAALVKAHGFDATAKADSTGSGGNTIFLHLMLDGFAGQPCNPTCTPSYHALSLLLTANIVLTARDAIIQADATRYAGANKCTLWNAFASKGLGVNAKSHNDDSTVPSGC